MIQFYLFLEEINQSQRRAESNGSETSTSTSSSSSSSSDSELDSSEEYVPSTNEDSSTEDESVKHFSNDLVCYPGLELGCTSKNSISSATHFVIPKLISASSSVQSSPGISAADRLVSTSNVCESSDTLAGSSTPVSSSNTGESHNILTAVTPALTRNTDEPTSNETSIDSASSGTVPILSPMKVGKRKRNESTWKRNVLKIARNSGKAYEKRSKKADKLMREERKIKPPCTEKCKLQCFKKISEDQRKALFAEYWNLGDLAKQREYIGNCTTEIKPRYRYVREGGQRAPRNHNSAFYFNIRDQRVRVCKLFFRNTLDINDRPIRTVLAKKNQVAGAVMAEDKRGKHGNQPKMDETMKRRIVDHINKIPKIESHYMRAKTTKHFIEGGRTITDIYNDYVTDCKRENVSFCNFNYFYNIFTNDFNLSFFVPKKDQCGMCVAYENATEEEKATLKAEHDEHLIEKTMARKEKESDKEKLKETTLLAVYDLQAVMPLPKGDCSAFYYSSKLNVFNFTIYDLIKKTTECYVWDESNGQRGVNELGSCVLHYLNKKIGTYKDVIFFSDNCSGQQKNQFMVAAYFYALRKLNLNSITHKFLIKGHTQNEGDSVHSLIERKIKQAVKSGPIYTPEGLIALIKTARRTGEPLSVNELSFEDFYDLKRLTTDIGPLRIGKNLENEPVKFKDIKVLRIQKDSPNSFFYKLSYKQESFLEAVVIKKKKTDVVSLHQAYDKKIKVSDSKKTDLMNLINKNFIPKVYKSFYENI